MKRIMIIGMLVLMSFSVNAATVSHSASEVQPGSFATGNYYFDGKVGVGTTGPESDLHIHDSSDKSQIRVTTDVDLGGNNYASIWFASDHDGTQNWAGIGQVDDGSLKLTGGNSLSSPAMVISDTGEVGIGTTSPGDLLHISGGNLTLDRKSATNGVTRSITIGGTQQDTGTDFATLKFQNYDNNFIAQDYSAAEIAAQSPGSSGGILVFRTTPQSSSSNTEVMRIDHNGNVGIGTTSPSEKLEVDGNVEISGNILGSDGNIVIQLG